ncbi:MAG: hypothetical protein JWL59_3788 [Chthoniobacteraceae bacterium]|nr:hypothetical protein [Chthoniobacteraceae bacterium]
MSMVRPPSFFELCRAEPFRIFFPLGLLVGISGVSLWPLYFSGLHKFYPGVMHARMMIEGFLGAFVLGFLGTAMPRLTGTGPFSRLELTTLLALYIGAVGTHIAERYLAADCIFLALLITFALLMGKRFTRRTDLPPPGFLLVIFGFFNAIAGTALLIHGSLGEGSAHSALFGTQLLYQGFVLYLVLGVGGFLLPRFLQLPEPEFPESRTPSPEWNKRAAFALAIGFLLLATFAADLWAPRWMALTRAILAGTFLFTQIPFHRNVIPRLTLTAGLLAALFFIVIGLVFPALWPAQRVAADHMVFIGGFTLLTLTVATRVVLGHGGQSHLFTTGLPFLKNTILLLLAGMILRVAGDFIPANRGSLLSYASYLWMFAAILWGWCVLPKVRISDQ